MLGGDEDCASLEDGQSWFCQDSAGFQNLPSLTACCEIACAQGALSAAKRLYFLAGGFASSYYWSSSENNNNNAWNQNFGSGDQNNNNKNNPFLVRAARGFKQGDLCPVSCGIGHFFYRYRSR